MESTLNQKESTYEASSKAIIARAESAEKKVRKLLIVVNCVLNMDHHKFFCVSYLKKNFARE